LKIPNLNDVSFFPIIFSAVKSKNSIKMESPIKMMEENGLDVIKLDTAIESEINPELQQQQQQQQQQQEQQQEQEQEQEQQQQQQQQQVKMDTSSEPIIETIEEPIVVVNGDTDKTDQNKSKQIKEPSDPGFILTTKNLERVRDELKQEQQFGQPKKLQSIAANSVTSSPVKTEMVRLFIISN
jgi:uncharacterized protein with von Willebrand factor type A (vWA) domain